MTLLYGCSKGLIQWQGVTVVARFVPANVRRSCYIYTLLIRYVLVKGEYPK